VLGRGLLDKLPPRPSGFGRHRELFPRQTGPAFDPIAPATVAADLTVGFLLDADRAGRLVTQHALDSTLPGLELVIDRLVAATFEVQPSTAYEAEVARAVQRVVVDRLMALAASASMPQVRAVATLRLEELADRLRASTLTGLHERAHAKLVAADVKRFLDRPAEAYKSPQTPSLPPGAPIGALDDPGSWGPWLDPGQICGWSAR
jgi:hypothetical protein